MNLFIELLMPLIVGFMFTIVLFAKTSSKMYLKRFGHIVLVVGMFSLIFYFAPTFVSMVFTYIFLLNNIKKFEKIDK